MMNSNDSATLFGSVSPNTPTGQSSITYLSKSGTPPQSVDPSTGKVRLYPGPDSDVLKLTKNFRQVPFIEVNPNLGVFAVVEHRAARQPNDILFNYKLASGQWNTVTAVEFIAEVKMVAKGLIAKGFKAKDVVAIMGHTSYNWIVMDYACALLGIISVPIYETSSDTQIRFILEDARVQAAFVENVEMFAKLDSIGAQFRHYSNTFVFEQKAVEELSELGLAVSDAELNAMAKNVKGSNLYTIVYTSGSTGSPRGVELTHGALVSIAVNTREGLVELLCRENSVFLLFLPMAHIFARYACLAIINSVSEIGVTGSIATLLDDLRYLKPTYTIAVPRVLEKIFNAASHKAGTGLKGQIFKRAVQTAIDFSQALDTEEGASMGLARKRKVFDRLVYGQIKAVLGGRMEYMVSGGAPLSPTISHFFRGAGINVLEGYGLTETSGTTFVNRAGANTIGSLGYPMAGMEYKIDPEGQLWIKYPSLLTCYHNDPKLTNQVLQQGWLNTGDLAVQNADGSVSLTGRSKDLIVTAGGKNVSPVVLENRLKDNGLISNAVLVGDRKPYISCLITLDEEYFERWKTTSGIKNLSYRDAKDDTAFRAEIQRFVDQANLLVSRAESIRRFAILEEDFSEANGLLTTSLKLRRQAVYDRYADLINTELYGAKIQ